MQPQAEPIQTSPTTPLQQEPQLQEQTKSSFSIFKIFEAGIFEIFFIFFSLSIILIILNYFNVLSLQNTIPQLSFLPHLPTRIASQTTATLPMQYDVTAADIKLENYLKETVTDAFLPTIASKSADPFLFVQDKNVFSSFWKPAHLASTSAAAISTTGTLILQKNTNIPSIFQMHIRANPIVEFDLLSSADASQKVAAEIIKDLPPQPAWSCRKLVAAEICTQIITNAVGKIQYAVTVRQDTAESRTIITGVASCLLPTGSVLSSFPESCSSGEN